MSEEAVRRIRMVPVPPVEVPVTIVVDGKEVSRLISIRPFSLKDEAWRTELFGDKDIIEACSNSNDPTAFCKMLAHQTVEEDRSMICEAIGVANTEEEFFNFLMSLPSDPDVTAGILGAVFAAWGKSIIEGGEVTGKKSLALPMMRWLIWSLGCMVGGSILQYLTGHPVNFVLLMLN